MALQIGDQNATSGMTKAIYDQMAAVLEPGLDGLEEGKKTPIRDNWKKTAYAVAAGVIEYLTANMEVHGITCAGNVNAAVSGSTAAQSNVVFAQNNDGTGHVS